MDRKRAGRGVFARAVAGTLLLVIPAAALAALAIALGVGEREPLDLRLAPAVREARAAADPESDPFRWAPSRREDLERRATFASSHVIYAMSPGGVVASAERTAAYREEIEGAADRHGLDPDVLEAVIFLESAGRPYVSAGPTPEAASGLAQIIPSTATDLLGMQVDLEASIALTRKIARARTPQKVDELRAQRAAADERFDPAKAIEGAATYLEIARERFGVDDLAVESYHMGIGNLESVIRAYLDAGDE
ncbi:MAG TPA: transglycosylase SLT domain-containing protein, partial [Solirubrobacterales bacterium]|nr:transglycosylase SLT domain-containing protein [Solirubrobacterales bacterium]